MNTIYEDEIAVLIPCLNEEATVGSVVTSFRKYFPTARIYVFDNGSDDNTAAIAIDAGASVVSIPTRGKGNVMREMFRRVSAEIYILVDGDDTYFAEDAPRMVDLLVKDQLDMVVGDRLSSQVYDEQNKRRFHSFGNRLVLRLINLLYRADCRDILSGYRIFSRRFVKNCPILSDGFEVETEITIHARDKKLLTREIPIQYRDRPPGSESKLSTIKDGIRILKTITLLFKDYKPLHFFSFVAVCFLVLGLICGIFPITEYFKTGEVTRFPLAFLAASLEVLSALLFCCGVILDTFARSAREQFELRLLRFNRQNKENE